MPSKRKRRRMDYPGAGYLRAKRNPNCRRLRVGDAVVYEDGGGRVHRRTFEIIAMERDRQALIKGWPDGVVRRGPMKRLLVARAALVNVDFVEDEAFKEAHGIPEDLFGLKTGVAYISIERKRRPQKDKR